MVEQTESRQTAAEIKKQINEATSADKAKIAIKESGMPITGMLAAEINASGPVTDGKSKAESKPDPAKAAEESVDEKSARLKEWGKKKGVNWTEGLPQAEEDSILSALHKSDQAFHAKRQEDRAKEVTYPPQGNVTPPPNYPMPQQPQQPSNSNGYAPPPPPNRQAIENIARNYNMLPEDAERFLMFSNDLFEARMTQERSRQNAEMAEKWGPIERDTRRNTIFRELSSDPALRDPEIKEEFDKVLEGMRSADPQSFERDPSMYTKALDRSVNNVARRNLGGRKLEEGVPPTALPVNPPPQLGNGSGGGSLENETGVDPVEFRKLSLEDKKAVMEKMGLIKGY